MSAPCPALGFVVRITMHPHAGDAEIDALIDDLLERLEAEGLTTAGAGDRSFEFVVEREGGQTTEADRTLVRRWAASWSEQATISVGDIVDLHESA